ncbi:MAG TPA: DNA translocase FtsK [Pseudogracilibacillus sp.]|nr:DNA translocase FtsK [Pseudogracilibacillus sp.]
MSNNWKKRVSDFFFEEIEIGENEPEEKQSEYPVERTYPTNKQSINTRVAYHYAKNKQPTFRFPVIPDEDTQDIEEKNAGKRHTKRRHLRGQRSSHRNTQPAMTRQPLKKELDNVPAYLRRRKARDNSKMPLNETSKNQEGSLNEEKQDEATTDPLAGYTRPEELDRVFRIRDGYHTPEQIEEQNHEIKNEKTITDIPDQEPEEKLDEEAPAESSCISIDEVKEEPTQTEPEWTQKAEPYLPKSSSNSKNDRINNNTEKKGPALSDVPNYLLDDPMEINDDDMSWVQEQQYLLNQTLEHFNIDAEVVNVTQGPSVTRFEIQPALGVKVSRIRGLSDDIKLNMAARDIRMEAPIPGKHTIGIEVPNEYPQMVSLQEIIESKEFEQSTSALSIALGLTIEGEPLITTIDKMPHGLIAGATGSGKSVCMNSIILSIMYKSSHEDVKFLMIDPKMVELTPYNGIPHLISPVITDAKAATMALKWAVNEMEERYEKLADARVRNIERYNEKMNKEGRHSEKFPYMVIVIDELADLMMVSPQEVEEAVSRIAQKARACGMHLLLATQRPSVDVITGLIKANIPTRIAFSVSSQVDSRTILDTNGAEKLLGKGDMLFIENGASKSVRLQGPFVSDEEIDRVANYARQIAEPNYLFEQEQLLLEVENENEDELLEEVIAFVVNHGEASTSLLQRRFRIGYNRAARLIDSLEHKGIISAANGSKPRDVLITKSQLEDAFE